MLLESYYQNRTAHVGGEAVLVEVQIGEGAPEYIADVGAMKFWEKPFVGFLGVFCEFIDLA